MSEAINVHPGHGTAGRHPRRDFLDSWSGQGTPGMFGRMFSTLPALSVDTAALADLAKAMIDTDASDAGDNPSIPAGFTYLGQFIDHDITLDLTALGEKVVDPMATQNFRTPRLDLDSLYGLGPDGSPQLYARDPQGKRLGTKLLLGKTGAAFNDFGNVPPGFPNDLPRSPEGVALIGDHRNDENLLVAQMHVAFLKFHNAVVDLLSRQGLADEALFKEARRHVMWHYQWMVLNDFVERLTEPGTVARILQEGRRFYHFKRYPYIPVEFSGAAYRLGHSMVRPQYSHNRVFTSANLGLFFQFTGLSGGIHGNLAPNPMTGPIPAATLPSNWIIDWRRYFDLHGAQGVPLNLTRRIDPFLVQELHTRIPGGGLALANLRRGVTYGLPAGQDVARFMEIPNPLTAAEIATGPDGEVARRHGLHERTPLWYYILKEAQQRNQGLRLGPVGSHIVAEVFVGLLQGDTESYLWNDRNWRPTLPAATPGEFHMTDLLRFVGDVNPIDA